MFHTALIMFQLTHQNSMKMSEIFVNKCIFINDCDIKLITIYIIIEIYMISYIFSMHKTIIVNVRLSVGFQLTCWLDQKSCTADHIIFKF